MDLILTDSQQCALAISEKDKRGNPALTTVPVTWEVSDATILTITPAADGLSADVVAAGPTGTAQVTATATLPDGTVLVGSLGVNVIAQGAATISISAGTPTEQ